MLSLENPIVLKITGLSQEQISSLEKDLTYTDEKVIQELARLRRNKKWITEEEFKVKSEELNKASKVCLLFKDNNYHWTYSGLSGLVSEKCSEQVRSSVKYPKAVSLPWDCKPNYDMYAFQAKALELLLEARHAGVEIGTGLGKSFLIINLVKRLGLKTVIMAPSASIAEQLHLELSKFFGKKKVGQFFDGKKEPKKQIVIATSQSLTRVEEGSVVWDLLSQTQVFIADESHQTPASTLASVCFGLLRDAPYRFFFSATQMRNDGAELLLNAITGPIVFNMTVKEGVDQKFLSKPIFRMIHVQSHGTYFVDDPQKMTRHHLFYNPLVAKKIGQLANLAVKANLPVLILINEVEQFTKVLPFLDHPVSFAHGTLAENKTKVPPEYWESDPNQLVKDFNQGKIKTLVGTSCISTGTDIKAVKFLVYWMGGSSEIQVKQAIGRGTRITPDKNSCYVVDFWVNSPERHPTKIGERRWGVGAHAEERVRIYNELYGPVVEDKLVFE